MPIGRRSTGAPPQFCPRCRRPAGGDESLCGHCGEALVPQGYCGICEQHWPLAVGEPCPKHEIPLDPPADEAADRWPSDVPPDWVTVQSYAHPMAAEAPRLRLDAEGIPTFLAGERMGANTLYQVATGGVKLQVPRALLADARVLLSQSWAPPEADDAIAGDDGEPEEPTPILSEPPDGGLSPIGTGGGWFREAVIVAVLIVLAIATVVMFRRS